MSVGRLTPQRGTYPSSATVMLDRLEHLGFNRVASHRFYCMFLYLPGLRQDVNRCPPLPAAASLPSRRSASYSHSSPLSQLGQNIFATLHQFAKYTVTRRTTLAFIAEGQVMQRHDTAPERAWNTKITSILNLFSGRPLYILPEGCICPVFSLFQRAWIFGSWAF